MKLDVCFAQQFVYPLIQRFVKIAALSALLLNLSACGANSVNNVKSEKPTITQSEDTMSIARQDVNKNKVTANMMTLQGQIVYQTMEGGFFSFIADDGSKYTPMQLPKEHLRNGLIVEIQAQEMHDVMTTMQFGKVIKIINVEVLDESKVTEIKTKL
jgi:hypothetical protein